MLYLQIDPDGPGKGVVPFEVQCYLSSDLTPPIMESCADLFAAGYSINKEYLIDPDGPNNGVEPFVVYCDLFTGGKLIIASSEHLQLCSLYMYHGSSLQCSITTSLAFVL